MRHGDIGFYINLHNDLVAPYIAKLGTEEQKDRLMPGIVSGEKILAVAMTEPGTGSDLAGMKARAAEKDDHWLLNGTKTYISIGILSDVFVVAESTAPHSRHALGPIGRLACWARVWQYVSFSVGDVTVKKKKH